MPSSAKSRHQMRRREFFDMCFQDCTKKRFMAINPINKSPMFVRIIQTAKLPKKEFDTHWEENGGSPAGWREVSVVRTEKGLKVTWEKLGEAAKKVPNPSWRKGEIGIGVVARVLVTVVWDVERVREDRHLFKEGFKGLLEGLCGREDIWEGPGWGFWLWK